ncbi:MAG: DUF4382 domain-containing protein [Proteobacteria bacterium]|nr:DUF4382 domain-containing protein [Pseudomonadota bacterium]
MAALITVAFQIEYKVVLMKTLQTIKFIFAALIFSVLAACSSGTDTSTTTAAPGTGRVSLLITDGPTNDFDQINVTVESISFLCEDDNDDEDEVNPLEGDDDGCREVVLFEETRVINLLALRNYSDLLSTTTVPAYTYSKIRLHVSRVELVRFDINGVVYWTKDAKLSSKKIDLSTQGSFEVVEGGYLAIELDMDANRAIQVVETGNGKFIFRPVIFVNILGVEDLKLVILQNRKVLSTDTGFQLCELDDVEVNDECLALLTSANTVVQDDQIDVVIPPAGLEDNDIVTVLGKLGYGSIDALHIVIAADAAEPQKLALFAGMATSPVAVDDSFTMETDDSDNNIVAPGTLLTATLATSARVFDKYGMVVTSDNIKDGSDVDVFGLADPDLVAPATVKAAFAIFDNDDLELNFSGVIVTIIDTVITVEIDNGSSTTFECADINDARILLLGSAGSSSTSEDIAIDQLLVGMSVDVYGEDEGLSCLTADTVLVTALP